jgi:hypothetical protein
MAPPISGDAPATALPAPIDPFREFLRIGLLGKLA